MDESTVVEISYNIARPFIEKWHYSHRVPTGGNLYFGWYIIANSQVHADTLFGETLYAVANYGIGVNCYQADYLTTLVGYSIPEGELLELKRLCRIEPKLDDFPLSHFLSRCHRLLKRKGYRFVVAFSDPYYGHTGGIYRASNFIHLGQTNPEFHVQQEDGSIRHRRYPKRFADRKGIAIDKARRILGLTRIQMPPKDRWFIEL